MEAFESLIRYSYHNKALMNEALTHSSYSNEGHRGARNNERLEFLGDSVLGVIVAEHLFMEHPGMPEGELTRTRAALVCEGSLHEVAKSLELGRYLRLGRGEDAGGGRTRPSILADATEAMLAAVYLDGGMEAVRPIIQTLILNKEREKAVDRDYKTALQELIQRTPGSVVSYRLVRESGPDHCRSFEMEASVDGKVVGMGAGRTKKEAEQMAARTALEKLNG